MTVFQDTTLTPVNSNAFQAMSMAKSNLGINSSYLTKNGKPFLPVMGEFHFSRYPNADWEKELMKMQADGVNIVSTYLFWNHHEEQEGQWNFSGDRDLKKFTELAKKTGLMVILRLGPWAHGEARYGGFPDFIQHKSYKRTNDSRYLEKVKELFTKYYEQSKDSFYDGNSGVIGIQLENELFDKNNHIETLRQIAIDVGFKLPFYTKTAWPESTKSDTVFPLFGCYPDAPWDNRLTQLPMDEKYCFKSKRADENIGNDILEKTDSTFTCDGSFPFATCELGCGIQITHHRRPIISPMDAYSLCLVNIGSGLNLIGYYIYHGGRNPLGGLYQESRRTGYPNNLPIVSYDFQCAINEFGSFNKKHRYLRLLHYFVNDFGDMLAPMQTKLLPGSDKGSDDILPNKMCIRTDENGCGFLFLNTYQRFNNFSAIKEDNVKIGKTVIKNVCLEGGKSCFWAFNITFGSFHFDYIKAQLLCKFNDGVKDNYVFFSPDGSFTYKANTSFNSNAQLSDGEYTVSASDEIKPIISDNSSNIYCLPQDLALHIFKTPSGNSLVFGEDEFYSDGAQTHIIHKGSSESVIYVLGDFAPLGYELCGNNGELKKYRKVFSSDNCDFRLEKVKGSRKEREHYLFSFKPKTEYKVNFDFSKNKADDIEICFEFKGDVVQMYADNLLIYDNYNLDEKLSIRLSSLLPYMKSHDVRFRVSQLSKNKKIYTQHPLERNIASLNVSDITPVYDNII